MQHVIIRNAPRAIDTEEQLTTALFEMAIAGEAETAVWNGAADCADAYRGGEVLRINSLTDLLAVLKEAENAAEHIVEDADLSGLPSFGGDAPDDTAEVWSWDAENLLVGRCISEMRIVPRDEVSAC